ncbi:uncharacterized protein LOC135085657 isoform X3 [Ostrinia nubilalis]|uniref:uncharacterized protein LOC135085657 isoform X3 n=1 Tax=Ostrinia nubilalis TaxID=29057 RepID=UPI0030823D3E
MDCKVPVMFTYLGIIIIFSTFGHAYAGQSSSILKIKKNGDEASGFTNGQTLCFSCYDTIMNAEKCIMKLITAGQDDVEVPVEKENEKINNRNSYSGCLEMNFTSTDVEVKCLLFRKANDEIPSTSNILRLTRKNPDFEPEGNPDLSNTILGQSSTILKIIEDGDEASGFTNGQTLCFSCYDTNIDAKKCIIKLITAGQDDVEVPVKPNEKINNRNSCSGCLEMNFTSTDVEVKCLIFIKANDEKPSRSILQRLTRKNPVNAAEATTARFGQTPKETSKSSNSSPTKSPDVVTPPRSASSATSSKGQSSSILKIKKNGDEASGFTNGQTLCFSCYDTIMNAEKCIMKLITAGQDDVEVPVEKENEKINNRNSYSGCLEMNFTSTDVEVKCLLFRKANDEIPSTSNILRLTRKNPDFEPEGNPDLSNTILGQSSTILKIIEDGDEASGFTNGQTLCFSCYDTNIDAKKCIIKLITAGQDDVEVPVKQNEKINNRNSCSGCLEMNFTSTDVEVKCLIFIKANDEKPSRSILQRLTRKNPVNAAEATTARFGQTPKETSKSSNSSPTKSPDVVTPPRSASSATSSKGQSSSILKIKKNGDEASGFTNGQTLCFSCYDTIMNAEKCIMKLITAGQDDVEVPVEKENEKINNRNSYSGCLEMNFTSTDVEVKCLLFRKANDEIPSTSNILRLTRKNPDFEPEGNPDLSNTILGQSSTILKIIEDGDEASGFTNGQTLCFSCYDTNIDAKKCIIKLITAGQDDVEVPVKQNEKINNRNSCSGCLEMNFTSTDVEVKCLIFIKANDEKPSRSILQRLTRKNPVNAAEATTARFGQTPKETSKSSNSSPTKSPDVVTPPRSASSATSSKGQSSSILKIKKNGDEASGFTNGQTLCFSCYDTIMNAEKCIMKLITAGQDDVEVPVEKENEKINNRNSYSGCLEMNFTSTDVEVKCLLFRKANDEIPSTSNILRLTRKNPDFEPEGNPDLSNTILGESTTILNIKKDGDEASSFTNGEKLCFSCYDTKIDAKKCIIKLITAGQEVEVPVVKENEKINNRNSYSGYLEMNFTSTDVKVKCLIYKNASDEKPSTSKLLRLTRKNPVNAAEETTARFGQTPKETSKSSNSSPTKSPDVVTPPRSASSATSSKGQSSTILKIKKDGDEASGFTNGQTLCFSCYDTNIDAKKCIIKLITAGQDDVEVPVKPNEKINNRNSCSGCLEMNFTSTDVEVKCLIFIKANDEKPSRSILQRLTRKNPDAF